MTLYFKWCFAGLVAWLCLLGPECAGNDCCQIGVVSISQFVLEVSGPGLGFLELQDSMESSKQIRLDGMVFEASSDTFPFVGDTAVDPRLLEEDQYEVGAGAGLTQATVGPGEMVSLELNDLSAFAFSPHGQAHQVEFVSGATVAFEITEIPAAGVDADLLFTYEDSQMSAYITSGSGVFFVHLMGMDERGSYIFDYAPISVPPTTVDLRSYILANNYAVGDTLIAGVTLQGIASSKPVPEMTGVRLMSIAVLLFYAVLSRHRPRP